MSVLVKGMEMPESCGKCPFLDYEEGFCFASGIKHKCGWYESTLCPGSIKDGRHDQCPLIPIPQHGRLIDADAFVVALETLDYSGAPDTLEDWTPMDMTRAEIADIKAAPTIIPAEPPKEER